jgi:hypothetical protein
MKVRYEDLEEPEKENWVAYGLVPCGCRWHQKWIDNEPDLVWSKDGVHQWVRIGSESWQD